MGRLKPYSPETLPDREQEVLEALASAETCVPEWGGWLTPMFCGGRDGSHHSATLAKLCRHGLVEKTERGGWTRGSLLYRITPAGLELYESWRKWRREQWRQEQEK